MAKNRVPLQVSPDFKRKLDELQKKIMLSRGENRSLRQITEDIISSPLFCDIERNILNANKIKFDVKIKLDRRFL